MASEKHIAKMKAEARERQEARLKAIEETLRALVAQANRLEELLSRNIRQSATKKESK